MTRLWLTASRPHRTWLYAVAGMLLLPGLCLATDVRVVAVTAGQSGVLHYAHQGDKRVHHTVIDIVTPSEGFLKGGKAGP